MADGAVPVDGALDDHPAAHRIEGRDLDHGVVTELDDHGIGCRGEVADAAVVVHGVDRHRASGPEHAVELRQDPVAVGVVVVAERVQPADDRIERTVDREVADVALEVRDGVRRDESGSARASAR